MERITVAPVFNSELASEDIARMLSYYERLIKLTTEQHLKACREAVKPLVARVVEMEKRLFLMQVTIKES